MKTEKRKILTGLTLSLILIVQLFETKAQNIAITDDNGYYADSSAMLDVKSTTKGILIPRLTTSQRNNVNNPAKGLLIFDSDENSFFFYNGTIWLNISTDSDIWTKSGINVYTSGMTDKVGVGTSAPVGKLEVKADGTINPGEPIFEVINSTGDTVFAVYSEGVRIYVADSSSKTGCNRAGFAVGGFSLSKGITNEYLRVTPDSVRIYIAENDDSKAGGNRAGFAVGGFSLSKGFTNEYLRVTNDSTRIYTEDTLKGFGVQNIDLTKKNNSNSYIHITPNNCFIGHSAGKSITTGLYNSFIGYQSGYSDTSGSANVANGYQTLYYNTSGYNNVAIGVMALHSNTTGYSNTANGDMALYSNTEGSYNTAVGTNTLRNNTIGIWNTAIGYSALRYNTGSYNVACGMKALEYNTTGGGNTAFGMKALQYNTTGYWNAACGDGALYSNTTGYNNTANGHQSLNFNTSGYNNTANGKNALHYNTTGSENTAIGVQALVFNTIGYQNTACGRNALYSDTAGYNNTALGYSAFFDGIGFSNSTAIGYNTEITASNQVRIGDANVTSIGGFADWSNISDKRFKKDIQETVPGLDFILKLRPVTYHLDMKEIAEFLHTPDSLRQKDAETLKENILQTGFIAQDVEKAANELGYDFSGVDKPKNEKDYYGLRYAEFTVPLVKAVQEQQEIIENQKTEIDNLKKESATCKVEIENLKIQVDKLSSLLFNSTSAFNKYSR